MDSLKVDVAVVGGGTAGLGAWRAAKAAGARAVLINAGPWGTTCVRVGCMPSKLLLAAADAARDARNAPTFGVLTGELRIDGHAVMERVRKERDRFLQSILQDVHGMAQDEKIEGRARFSGPNTLLIDDRITVEARAIVIATGSSPEVLDVLASVRAHVLTNETVFDLETLPGSIAVVGAGPVGLELGIAFARLGVRTTVFDEGESIGGLKDAEVGKVARELMAAEMELKLGVKLSAEPADGGARLSWKGAGGEGHAVFDRVLVATGRPPNVKDLNLPASGLELDEDGVPQHDHQTRQCGTSAVFIAGDAGDDLPVLHEASRQGDLAGRNAARFPKLDAEPPPTPVAIVFTSPDLASVGQSLQVLGEGARITSSDFASGRGQAEARPGGMIRLYVAEDRLAGGEMVGAGVEHLAQMLAFMIQAKMTVQQALALPFYHPTYEEVLQACLQNLRQQG